MKKLDLRAQEGSGRKLIEEISRIKHLSGARAAMCQRCGSTLDIGDAVAVSMFRSAGDSVFQLGNVYCGEEIPEFPTNFTLGVCELLLKGILRSRSDGESKSLVLTETEVQAVSKPSTKSVHKFGTDAWDVATVPSGQPRSRVGQSDSEKIKESSGGVKDERK